MGPLQVQAQGPVQKPKPIPTPVLPPAQQAALDAVVRARCPFSCLIMMLILLLAGTAAAHGARALPSLRVDCQLLCRVSGGQFVGSG